jgi:hypothetical protein
MKLHLPESSRNWLTLTGATIALISLFMIIFLFAVTSILNQNASYIGLVIYILLPAIMITGLLLIPIGMIFTSRRRRKESKKEKPAWPRIDLNDIRHRNAFFIFTVGTTIFLFLSAIGSYEAFHYTESVPFCGTVCHQVMHPEYTAYQNSPHARVACVDCHVGTGADWYVRSKLSGLYQVYATTFNLYPRPIPTPIENLRPARETCETCHWPEKFYARKLRIERHYLNDEENTPWDIHLTVKIGSEYSALGLVEGIHWHINPNVKIEYITTDEKHLSIPWVRYTDVKTGETVIYQDEEGALDENELKNYDIHTMDCMDCHNRPSHSYQPPAYFVNEAITADVIPNDLPEIKSQAMEICAEEFETTAEAISYIDETLTTYYTENYPELLEKKPQIVDRAINGLQNVYRKNIFPEMNVRWSAYPNQIGHLEFDGCFRCHNDRHTSEIGQIITKDCDLCHSIIAQGTPGEMTASSHGESLTFQHPVDIDMVWQESLCTDCHTGLNP